jgi:DNA repair exonuclease SbcCD ATPase subunit
MGYKGEDLDLRTPQLWSGSTRDAIEPVPRESPQASNSGWPRSESLSAGGTGPIWVDETVMACCNQAYDLAAAHRAAEVRLEHLLDALTLVEAAARILEQRGILVTALRRDVGAMIATELPVGSSSGKETPQRSLEFEKALRLAAERAYPRHTPVTTDELLRVLFDLNRELPAIQLLHHHSTDWSPRELVDPHFAEPQGPRARMRVPAGSQYLNEPPAEVEVARADPNRLRGWADDRLTTLERSIDMWLGELSRTGSVLADRVRSLEQGLQAARSEIQIVPAALSEKLQSLENRQRKLDDVERTLSLLLDRVAGYERYIKRRAPPETAELASIGERLAALERAIASTPTVSVDLSAVEGRLQAIATHAEDTGRTVTGVADRLKSLEDVLGMQLPQEVSTLGSEFKALASEMGAQQAQGERRLQHFTERLRAAAAAIEGQGEALATKIATPVVERLAGLGAEVRALAGEVSAQQPQGERLLEQFMERLQAGAVIEREALTTKVATPVVERLAGLGAEIRALAGEVGAQRPQGERLLEQFTERLQALAAVIERESEALALKVATPVVERLSGLDREIKALAGEVGAQQPQSDRFLEQFTERLQALAAVIEREGEALAMKVAGPVVERLSGLDREIKAFAGEVGAQQAQGERLMEQFTERLQTVVSAINGQSEALVTKVATPLVDRLAGLGSEIKALAGEVGAQQAQGERRLEQLTERLQAVASVIEGQGEALAVKVATPIAQRLAGLGGVLEQSQAGMSHALGQFTDRLGAVDRSLDSCGQQTSQLQAAHTRGVTELRDALLTVNGSQQTIATVVDQWRFDTTGDLSIISNRLQALERATLRPELIESLTSTVRDLHRLLEEREEHNGLRRWLRGTDDGAGASRASRTGIEPAAKPPRDAGGGEPRPDGRKSWLQHATDFVRRRRAK